MANELASEGVATPAQAQQAPQVQVTDIHAACPMSVLLEMLTRPWTLHILWLLGRNGPMRFGALRRGIEGISPRLLTLRLRSLEQDGFVRRTVVPGKMPEVTYSPTNRATDMEQVMRLLHSLSEKWQAGERAN